jgi:hypothetical protein
MLGKKRLSAADLEA